MVFYENKHYVVRYFRLIWLADLVNTWLFGNSHISVRLTSVYNLLLLGVWRALFRLKRFKFISHRCHIKPFCIILYRRIWKTNRGTDLLCLVCSTNQVPLTNTISCGWHFNLINWVRSRQDSFKVLATLLWVDKAVIFAAENLLAHMLIKHFGRASHPYIRVDVNLARHSINVARKSVRGHLFLTFVEVCF